jgi:putative phosphoesterase
VPDRGTVRIAVLADTHLLDAPAGAGPAGTAATRPRRGRPVARTGLPDDVWAFLDGCHLVLHAGDVLGPGTLHALERVAPTYAVLGNNDTDLVGVLPATRRLLVGGVTVAMVHDSGPSTGRDRRMRRRFPDADVVVFGHSHLPWNAVGVDGQILFNPGSPTQRRSAPARTVGELLVAGGRLVGRRIVELGP